jgi:hypothetical protein
MMRFLILKNRLNLIKIKISVNHDNHDNQRSIGYWQNLKSVFILHHLVAGKQ